MDLEIWIDYTCPFCYLGKLRFLKALNRFKYKKEVNIVFRSYLLSPNDDNLEKLNGHDWLAKHKDISLDKAKSMNLSVEDMAFNQGVLLDFNQIIPRNTLFAHKLMKQVSGVDQLKFVSDVFEADRKSVV